MTDTPGVRLSESDTAVEAALSEIEITDQMLEAGLEAYLKRHPDSGMDGWHERRVVKRIYAAMKLAEQGKLEVAFQV